MKVLRLVLLLLPLLAACDQLKERAGFHDPAKLEAEGKAIGAACRNAGQGLEDCYRLNPETGKAAIFAGWKDMNEYMSQNKMDVIPPPPPPPPKAPKADENSDKADADKAEEMPAKGAKHG